MNVLFFLNSIFPHKAIFQDAEYFFDKAMVFICKHFEGKISEKREKNQFPPF